LNLPWRDAADSFSAVNQGRDDQRSDTMTTAEQDREAIIAIVQEMADSMTGAQSTRHWAEDVLWFDIPPFASRGVPPALKLFDDTFAKFESCKVEILELDATVNGDMGIVCSVQSTNIVLKGGATRHVMARQTDCFERRQNGWELIHQHASVPAGGEWDGTVTTA
jgi:ketosteroid isomerase-like protein